ncbi:MAG TPA: M20/M25/M40 family metallo-hydrolase [Sedimentisphaerales bacterium]|nr:M20/M25/M40 family metallo-hydrolase [Sedimentisphaerales bacterium]
MFNQNRTPKNTVDSAGKGAAEDAKPRKKPRVKIVTRGSIVRLAVLAAVLAICCLGTYLVMIKMPGKSYTGPLPPLTDEQLGLRDELVRDIEMLASQIGERNVWTYASLTAAADFIEASLTKVGYKPRRQNFTAAGKTCCNIEVQIKGAALPNEIVIIGAHYDTVPGSPGANDNGSGVAAALALARRFADQEPARTLRFVFFANEEPPFFQTGEMGSLVYAKSCKEKGENIVAMLSLETIGYYTDKPNSQQYPFPFSIFYPSTGNFLGFVSDLASRELLHRTIASFRRNCKFPSEGGAIPQFIPGIAWSDQWSFWQQGYPAIMLTDTAPFRYPYYHSQDDTADEITFDCLTRVISGLQSVVADFTEGPTD